MRLSSFKHNGYCPDPYTKGPVQNFEPATGHQDEGVGYDMFHVGGVTYLFRSMPVKANDPNGEQAVYVTLVMPSGGCGTSEGAEAERLYAEYSKKFPRPKDLYADDEQQSAPKDAA